MGTVVIVVMEPGRVGGYAFGLGSVGPRIGPFGGEGAVEAFDLAVCLGTIRTSESMCHMLCPNGRVLFIGCARYQHFEWTV